MSDPQVISRVLNALTEARNKRSPCVLATVVAFKGSTPRKPGAKMLVFPDRTIVGTIGGGALEYWVIEQAVGRTGAEEPLLLNKHLTHELGMCCGGAVSVLLETQTYAPRVLLFGAGHCAVPVATVACLAGFEVTVIDERAALATTERFPTASQVLVESPLDVIDDLNFDASSTYVLVMTHDHGLDEQITSEVLSRDFRYLGVIGSRRKAEMFRKRLASAGHEPSIIEKMRTPMGLDISSETPEEIAISIVAELVKVRRNTVQTGAT